MITIHYEIIINPASGSGKGSRVWKIIQQALYDQHVSFSDHISHSAGQPRQIVLQLLQSPAFHPDCIIVIGGDGTLHEVISGLMKAEQNVPIPVAYIPAGTGNDFARGYGISTNPTQALQQILNNQQLHTINIGEFNNNDEHGIFINNFGIGFDAAIVHQTNASKMKRFLNHHHLGSLSYISKAIGVLIHQPSFNVQVTVDSHQYHFPNGFLVVSSNHPYIGGGIKVAPDQKINQTELELVVLEKHDPLSLLGAIILFAIGKVAHSRFAHIFRGTTIKYGISPAQHGQIDGEELAPQCFNLQLSCSSYPFWEEPL